MSTEHVAAEEVSPLPSLTGHALQFSVGDGMGLPEWSCSAGDVSGTAESHAEAARLFAAAHEQAGVAHDPVSVDADG